MSLGNIGGIDPKTLNSLTPKVEPDEKAEKSFKDSLLGAFNEVNQMKLEADQAIEDLAVGRRKTMHETMIQVEEANIAFQMFMAVRGKILTAYQEVMRMNF